MPRRPATVSQSHDVELATVGISSHMSRGIPRSLPVAIHAFPKATTYQHFWPLFLNMIKYIIAFKKGIDSRPGPVRSADKWSVNGVLGDQVSPSVRRGQTPSMRTSGAFGS